MENPFHLWEKNCRRLTTNSKRNRQQQFKLEGEKMPERKGSSFAKELFEKSISLPSTVAEWEQYDQSYQEALQIVANQKKKPELIEIDHFIHHELPPLINARTPPYLQHSELAQLMKWKLTRGKSRPLQKLVESNTSVSVIDASTTSFRFLQSGEIEEAFDSIMKLRGVGVATASAIFAILYPDRYPFMADEVIESVTNDGREYTMPIYNNMRNALINKGSELGWNAERVGQALWSCAIISAHNAASKKHSRSAAKSASVEAAPESKAPEIVLNSTSSADAGDDINPDQGSNKRRKFSG